ncbi:MAG: hypothetical protein ABI193_14370 [Minicystis sp.]
MSARPLALLSLCPLLSALAMTALIGCDRGLVDDHPSLSTPGTAAVPDPPWVHPTVGADGKAIDVPADLGAGALPPPSRGVRRMRIDTLQAAMTRVAGNDIYGVPIEWKVNGKNGFSDGAFGKALGRPDFQTSTEEATVSNALYLKFVGDAARDTCSQMARNDQKRADPKTRTLFPQAPVDGSATDAQIADNVGYLGLRFLGLRLDPSDTMIPALRKVYDAGVLSVQAPNGGELTPAAEGWRGVCVTLFESALFHND